MGRARIRPVVFVWSGNYMVPLPRFKQQCDEQFVVHEEYPLTILEARSRASHNHYFATIEAAFDNLPEKIAAQYPNSEALRAKSLIECGYCDEKNFVCDSPGHARYLAMNLRTRSPYAVIRVSGNVVKVYDAHSQSAAAMQGPIFEKSKADVLDYLSGLIGVSVTDLKKAGAQRFKPEPKRRDS